MSSSMITPAFLNRLRSLYPSKTPNISPLSNPWYIVAAVAFSASNKPEGASRVFEHMLSSSLEFSSETQDGGEGKMILARKMREALFKSGLISGYPKAINSLASLSAVTPDHLRDTEVQRSTTISLDDYEKKGQAYWDSIYGANDIYGMLHTVYPDLAWFSKTIGYGLIYSHMQPTPSPSSSPSSSSPSTPQPPGLLTQLETSFTLVAALIAGDTPQQIAWHLAGARRCGASLEEVQAVRTIAMEVSTLCGVHWRDGVPEVSVDDG